VQINHSIIIPCGGAHQYLDKVYEHLMNLDYKFENFEIILVSNGPGVAAWAKGKENIQLVTETKRGPSSARNAGASVARGKWLTFIDDDVLVNPSWLKDLDQIIKSKSWINVISGTLKIKDLSNEFLFNFRKNLNHFITQGTHNYLFASYRLPVVNSSLFSIASNTFKKINGFNESFQHLEDTELTIRILRSGFHIYVLQKPLGEVMYVKDSLFSYIKRRFHKSLWFPLLLKSLNLGEEILPFHRGFLSSSWPFPGRWYVVCLEVTSLVAHSIGLRKASSFSPDHLNHALNWKSLFIFQLKLSEVSYHLNPKVCFIWFDDFVRIFRDGHFLRDARGLEMKSIEMSALRESNELISDDVKNQWVQEKIFIKLN
jgi:glycosyltransferase involved in cell wall biosynthesis